jgi:predicted secreted hydrolase
MSKKRLSRRRLIAALGAGALVRPAFSAPAAYPGVVPGAELRFPRDHGAHPDHRIEWWYVTGWLESAPQPLGFQVTFFRVRPGVAEAIDSPLAARQLIFAHAAVSDASRGKLLKAESAARVGIGAALSVADLEVRLNSWHMRRLADERIRMRVDAEQFSFDLFATPTQPLMLQGRNGFSQKGPDPRLASYYLSWPHLRVGGTLKLDGQLRDVAGHAWLDHEWSSEVLGDAGVGWDWIGINLADGGALMAFRIRDAKGAPVYAHAAHRDAQGTIKHYDSSQVQWIPKRIWKSAASGASYPVELEIRFAQHNVSFTPLMDNQELITQRTTQVTYWEGLVQMRGTLSGRGYLELTGYAGKLEL